MTEPLQPANLPLQGSALIEASAGTGKTWTIAALVLRLVLGHGAVVQRPDRPLQPAEILVMTFTRAATRELSDRIRGRLAEAAQVFRGQAAVPVGDEFLTELLKAYSDAASRGYGRLAPGNGSTGDGRGGCAHPGRLVPKSAARTRFR